MFISQQHLSYAYNMFPHTTLIFIFCTLFSIGDSMLRCYVCSSDKSLQDCENKQHINDGCLNSTNPSHDRCYVFQSIDQSGRANYGKSCIDSSSCDKKFGCYPNPSMCKVKCCTTPECNIDDSSSGYVKRPSFLLILGIASYLIVASWQSVK